MILWPSVLREGRRGRGTFYPRKVSCNMRAASLSLSLCLSVPLWLHGHIQTYFCPAYSFSTSTKLPCYYIIISCASQIIYKQYTHISYDPMKQSKYMPTLCLNDTVIKLPTCLLPLAPGLPPVSSLEHNTHHSQIMPD